MGSSLGRSLSGTHHQLLGGSPNDIIVMASRDEKNIAAQSADCTLRVRLIFFRGFRLFTDILIWLKHIIEICHNHCKQQLREWKFYGVVICFSEWSTFCRSAWKSVFKDIFEKFQLCWSISRELGHPIFFNWFQALVVFIWIENSIRSHFYSRMGSTGKSWHDD